MITAFIEIKYSKVLIITTWQCQRVIKKGVMIWAKGNVGSSILFDLVWRQWKIFKKNIGDPITHLNVDLT